MNNQDEVARLAADLAATLPPSQVRDLALVLQQQAVLGSPLSFAEVLESVPQPDARKTVNEFLEAWRARSPEMVPESAAAALNAAAWTVERFGKESRTELVWTGAEDGTIPLRRTEQVLLEVIGSAQRRLLIVSYAVYKARLLGEALLAAAGRGVSLTFVLDSADDEDVLKVLAGLHPKLRSRADILVWPVEQRAKDDDGRLGVLHVKCAVADDRLLFLSSANLTASALTVNMELGVLIREGPLPVRVVEQFFRLQQAGILIRKNFA